MESREVIELVNSRLNKSKIVFLTKEVKGNLNYYFGKGISIKVQIKELGNSAVVRFKEKYNKSLANVELTNKVNTLTKDGNTFKYSLTVNEIDLEIEEIVSNLVDELYFSSLQG